MRTDVIVIENNQEGREKALNAIEGMADVSGLSKKAFVGRGPGAYLCIGRAVQGVFLGGAGQG